MNQNRPSLIETVVKTAITHTVTYFVMGLLASTLLNYGRFYAESSLHLFMRQTTDPWVMAGPLFQPIRGILFGIVFYLLREEFFVKKNGWLTMWIVLVGVGIFGTFGPYAGLARRDALHRAAPFGSSARPAGGAASISGPLRYPLLLDQSRGQKVAQLGHGHSVRPVHVLSRTRPAGYAGQVGPRPHRNPAWTTKTT